jgi:hypothetical protein
MEHETFIFLQKIARAGLLEQAYLYKSNVGDILDSS